MSGMFGAEAEESEAEAEKKQKDQKKHKLKPKPRRRTKQKESTPKSRNGPKHTTDTLSTQSMCDLFSAI